MDIKTLIKKQLNLTKEYQMAIHRAKLRAINNNLSNKTKARQMLNKEIEKINQKYIPLAIKLGLRWLNG